MSKARLIFYAAIAAAAAALVGISARENTILVKVDGQWTQEKYDVSKP